MRLFNSASVPLFFIFCFLATGLQGQNQELRTSVADLTQDVRTLDQQVRATQFELELLKENSTAGDFVDSIQSLDKRIGQIEQALKAIRIEMAQRDKALGEQIMSKVTEALNDYVQSLSRASSSVPASKRAVQAEFSDDYPKTGLSYEVQSGDTLSQIALKFGSSVQYIQNANQIKDPTRDLRVGDTIFIPLREN